MFKGIFTMSLIIIYQHAHGISSIIDKQYRDKDLNNLVISNNNNNKHFISNKWKYRKDGRGISDRKESTVKDIPHVKSIIKNVTLNI